jgi:hypothetical protein
MWGDSLEYLVGNSASVGDGTGRDLSEIHISNPLPGGGFRYGGGGRYGGRLGGRRDLVARGGRPPSTEISVCVRSGLSWLARHQRQDGSWACGEYDVQCKGKKCAGPGYSSFDVGVTALAVLAHLHAGYTPDSREVFGDPEERWQWRPGKVVKDGLQWLMSLQAPNGSLVKGGHDRTAMEHAAATWALCTATELSEDRELRESAGHAVDFLLSCQLPYSGWGYDGGDRVNLIATAWAFRALAASQDAGLPFPPNSRTGIAHQLADGRSHRYFGALDVAYWRDAGKVVVQGKNEDWDDHPVGAAIALLAMPRCGRESAEIDRLFATALANDLPRYEGKHVDYHAWNFGAAAMALRRREFPEHARAFREALQQALIPSQKTPRDGCSCGSWDVDVDRWGFAGGRVFTTATNVLTLLDVSE